MSKNRIDLDKFKEVKYGEVSLFFDKNHNFHHYFGHELKTRRFPYHKNLIEFLKKNPKVKIFFTIDEKIKPFKRFNNGILINIGSYLDFCKSIASNTKGRARAFLGQHLNITNIPATESEKDSYVIANATEKNLIAAINKLEEKSRKNILKALGASEDRKLGKQQTSITIEQFLSAFTRFLSDERVQTSFFNQSEKVQLETLKKILTFLENNLNEGEKYIQDWIDEDKGRYRKQRCLIFGLEYIDPKREGELNRKKFDILAEQDREHHVLIELKSPKADIFEIKEDKTSNEGKSTKYALSGPLARAIPQILGYKSWYEEASAEELQKLGINRRRNISKCIIIIGKNKEDRVWKENLKRVRDSLTKIEIITYTDLIDKLQNTIKNLEENLEEIDENEKTG